MTKTTDQPTKQVKWRLPELPTAVALSTLIKDGVITKEEARSICINEGDAVRVDWLEAQVKFLQELVETLSANNRGAVREIHYPFRYSNYPWFNTAGFQNGANYTLVTSAGTTDFTVVN